MPAKNYKKPSKGMRFHKKHHGHKFIGKGLVNGLQQNRKITSLLARSQYCDFELT